MLQIIGNTISERMLAVLNGLGIDSPGVAIAEKTGYNKSTISEYLNEKRPSKAFVRKFCKAFGVEFEKVWIEPDLEKEQSSSVVLHVPDDEKELSTLMTVITDQAMAAKMNAQAADKYAEGFQALARTVELIYKEMARAEAQTIMLNKIEEIESSLGLIAERQLTIQAEVQAVHQWDAQSMASGDKEKVAVYLDHIQKLSADNRDRLMKKSKPVEGNR